MYAAMKPLKKKEFKISGVKLFLEDLERIIEIMGSGNKDVEIKDENSEYDSIADLKCNQENPKDLYLNVISPYISFEFNTFKFFRNDLNRNSPAGEMRLFASHDAEESFLKIREILINKKSRFSFILSHFNFFSWLAILWTSVSFVFVLYLDDKYSLGIDIVAILVRIISAPFLIIIFLFLFGIFGYWTSINLTHSQNKRSFIVKRKEDILINIVSAIIGALIGALMTYFVFGKA
jgi:hypothetical protein